MIGYYLEVGYPSFVSREEGWQAMKRIVADLCEHPERIAHEARRLGAPEELEGEWLVDYAMRYKDCDDGTIDVVETPPWPRPDAGEFRPYVAQHASGDGPSRVLKEHLRRAFCRLVIEAMHREGIEVNLGTS